MSRELRIRDIERRMGLLDRRFDGLEARAIEIFQRELEASEEQVWNLVFGNQDGIPAPPPKNCNSASLPFGLQPLNYTITIRSALFVTLATYTGTMSWNGSSFGAASPSITNSGGGFWESNCFYAGYSGGVGTFKGWLALYFMCVSNGGTSGASQGPCVITNLYGGPSFISPTDCPSNPPYASGGSAFISGSTGLGEITSLHGAPLLVNGFFNPGYPSSTSDELLYSISQ